MKSLTVISATSVLLDYRWLLVLTKRSMSVFSDTYVDNWHEREYVDNGLYVVVAVRVRGEGKICRVYYDVAGTRPYKMQETI